MRHRHKHVFSRSFQIVKNKQQSKITISKGWGSCNQGLVPAFATKRVWEETLKLWQSWLWAIVGANQVVRQTLFNVLFNEHLSCYKTLINWYFVQFIENLTRSEIELASLVQFSHRIKRYHFISIYYNTINANWTLLTTDNYSSFHINLFPKYHAR